MAFVPAIGAEPITGYQLIERLGTGGYGAVWKVMAPGGIMKAIKFVFGDMSGHQAEQELKALRRIKEVRHPFLLSLERYEVIDGQLIIVTELADKSLLDRFNECVKAGQTGVNRDELLVYIHDAAEALDYMADTHGLQHLDIKPQNLLIVAGRIKVADFGLVKDMVGTSVTATGGVTPIYATPEAFDGRVSRFSDQYSLAVVYQEMLTGVRPYPGATMMQLAAQHMSGRPLLDPLPPADRPIIAKALNKTPEKRYASCRELVDTLLKVNENPAPAHSSHPDFQFKADARTPSISETSRPTIPSGPIVNQVTVGADEASDLIPKSESRSPHTNQLAGPAGFYPCQEKEGSSLRPTLFVGLGARGITTLRLLKQRLATRFDRRNSLPLFQFMAIDTDRTSYRKCHEEGLGQPLDTDETILASLNLPEHYRSQSKSILKWLDRRWLFGIPRSLSTDRMRPLGLLAFMDHASSILDHLRRSLSQITSETILQDLEKSSHRIRSRIPLIFVVSSLGGATGGGMLTALGYAIRQVLEELKLDAGGLTGVLVHATSAKPEERDIARVNALATLMELKHFASPEHGYPGELSRGLKAFGPSIPPFEDCYLVHAGDQVAPEVLDRESANVAEYLYLNAASQAGEFFDQYRMATRVDQGAFEPSLRSFGLYRVHMAVSQIVDRATTLFCRNVVSRWPGDQTDRDKECIEQEAKLRLEGWTLTADKLIARFHEQAELVLGEKLGQFFELLIQPGDSADSKGSNAPVSAKPSGVLKPIDGVLGRSKETGAGTDLPPTPFQKSMAGKAKEFVDSYHKEILNWLTGLVESPNHRLTAAETAVRWLSQKILSQLDHVRSQINPLNAYVENLRKGLETGVQKMKIGAIAWLGGTSKNRNAAKSNSRAFDYCWARMGELALECSNTVLSSIYHNLTNFSQELILCRAKLTHFVGFFDNAFKGDEIKSQSVKASNLIEVFPFQAKDLQSAARSLVAAMPPELTRQFEENFQAEVLDRQSGLWGMLAGNREALEQGQENRATSSLAFWDLISQDTDVAICNRRILLERARPLIISAIAGLDPAQVFLDSLGSKEALESTIQNCLALAEPRPRIAGAWFHLLLALPSTNASEAIKQMITQLENELPTTVIPSHDDLVMSFEAAHCSLDQMAAALVDNKPSYADLARRVLTRIDVPWATGSMASPTLEAL